MDIAIGDPLSSVVFIHDGIQMIFQDAGFSLFGRVTCQSGHAVLRQGEAGFCDALVGLIGRKAVAQVDQENGILRLCFGHGAIVLVSSSGEEAGDPEAWQYWDAQGTMLVAQNAG